MDAKAADPDAEELELFGSEEEAAVPAACIRGIRRVVHKSAAGGEGRQGALRR